MNALPSVYYDKLLSYWGFDSLKQEQEQVIAALHAGKDCLGVLPTGYGKSLCYQLPAVVAQGVTLVVSPLVALMQEQTRALSRKGINTVNFSGNITEERLAELCDNIVKGWAKIVIISPERLFQPIIQEWLPRFQVSLIAIDEAHCISEWGHDFRPRYRELLKVRKLWPKVPLLALTATATPKVRADIVRQLQINGPVLHISVRRDELSLNCSDEPEKFLLLVESIKKIKGSAIVYQPNRVLPKSQSLKLKHFGVLATWYHGGLSASEKRRNMLLWMRDKVSVMEATKAFGMGVDKPDVRLVAHYFPPASMEEYVQEVGRAGRDGKRSYGLILFNEGDYERLKKLIGFRNSEPEFISKVYQSLANYLGIAENDGKDSSHHLDMDLFSLQHEWRVNEAYYALKRVEEAGYITLAEGIHHPAKLRWLKDMATVFECVQELPLHKEIIPALMHGIGPESFIDFANVPIGFVAQKSGVKPRAIEVFLRKLQSLSLAQFRPAKGPLEITFLTERYRANVLPLPIKVLAQARETAINKLQQVKQYADERNICRQILIQDYFDEVPNEACGICDNCRDKLPERKLEHVLPLLKPAIVTYVNTLPVCLAQDIMAQFRFRYKHQYITLAVAELLQEGTIEMPHPGMYKVTDKT